MTKHVATTELKAKLSEILGDVERGQTIGVTRHGKMIARIVPERGHDQEQVRQVIEGLRKFRASLPNTGVTLEDVLKWRHEGHRY
jgi:prevent-host-death family protein